MIIRQTRRQRLMMLSLMAVPLVLAAMGLTLDGEPDNPDLPSLEPLRWAVVAVCVTAAVLLVVAFFDTGRRGVTLTPHGITVHRTWTRHYAWPEVYVIRTFGRFGKRRVLMQLVGGRTLRLPAPIDNGFQPDPEFDRKVAAMQQWHVAHVTHRGHAGTT